MEFLRIYEVGNKDYLQYDNNFKRIFIQEDVWDFHVFRVIEESENNFTIEMDNIDKESIAEKLNIPIPNFDSRHVFKMVMTKKVLKAIIDFDIDRGFETYESCYVESMQEVIETITEDMYEMERNLIW